MEKWKSWWDFWSLGARDALLLKEFEPSMPRATNATITAARVADWLLVGSAQLSAAPAIKTGRQYIVYYLG